ncbi:hypothetical protein AB4Z48_01920 [Cupriavidus sp. 2TAF22]|uniref:hypothetical protein n=1 Tax=unclassified Cupriavidus TaxID=2640874 RepID=UPI003F91A75B
MQTLLIRDLSRADGMDRHAMAATRGGIAYLNRDLDPGFSPPSASCGFPWLPPQMRDLLKSMPLPVTLPGMGHAESPPPKVVPL